MTNRQILHKDVIDGVKNISFVLSSEIRRQNISYRQAAAEIGVSHSCIHYIVTGKREPTSSTIISILEWVIRNNAR